MIDNKIRRAFVVVSLLVLFFFLWQIWKEYHPPYLPYQKEFRKLLIQKAAGQAEIADFKFGVRQRWVEKLSQVDRCETCHLGVEDSRFEDAPQPFKSHPDVDRHPIEDFGCTVCHGGWPMATSLKKSHGPTKSWIKTIYHENFMENSCSLCHGNFIQEAAPVLSKGREMFKEFGCRGCHKIKGTERVKTGPPLKKIGEKVKTDWLYRWLIDPKGYFKNTKMPDFKFAKQQAADIAAFLVSRLKSGNTKKEIKGSYDRGKTLFGESRCITCHSVEGRGGDIGPDLAKVSSKMNPEWLYRWIKNPQGLRSNTKMPNFGFSDQEVRDLVTFLIEEYIDIELEEEQVVQDLKLVAEGDGVRGKGFIEKYGCAGCHEMEGVENRPEIGLDLTKIGDIHVSRLDFGEIQVDPEHRTVPNWIYNKMRNPRLFKEDLKMPDYHFSDRDAEAVTTYLLGLKYEEIPHDYTLPLGEPPSEYAPQGEFGKILKKYRCLVCHKINGKGGELAPDLSQEGSRVRKEWMKKYMKTPYAIRPILAERMPRFKISDSEIETLYSYFRTALVDDRVEELSGVVDGMTLQDPKITAIGKKLYYEKYGCNACHQINLKGGTVGPDFTGAGDRLRPEWIVHYLRDPKAFLNRSVEPVFDLTDQEIEALTAFLTNLKEKR